MIKVGKMEKLNGRKEGIIAVAKKLLEQRVEIETIIQVTGLTKEEIEKL